MLLLRLSSLCFIQFALDIRLLYIDRRPSDVSTVNYFLIIIVYIIIDFIAFTQNMTGIWGFNPILLI